MARRLSSLFRFLEPRQYSRSSAFNASYLAGIRGTVLDVGCGDFLTKYGFGGSVRYYGMDITGRATHVRGDAHYLPFREAAADWVLLVAMLEHVADPALVLREVGRVLKPGGYLYVAVPFLQMEHGDTDFCRWTTDGVDRLLAQNGFEVVKKGTNGGFFLAMDYLLWHRFREACHRRDAGMALAALLMKAVAQPAARLARDVDSPTYATSFHILARKPGAAS
ncbi:MAG TPA: class I SAM-dependent methyltransferase [Chloroflexota bacterium]